MNLLAEVPEPLRAPVQERLDLLTEGLAEASPALRKELPRIFAASPFVADVCTRDAGRFTGWARSGWFETAYQAGDYARDLPRALQAAQSEEEFMAGLRRLRAVESSRIALRDLAGWAPLDETLLALSELAETATQAALDRGARVLQARYGVPREESGAEARPFVLGMGKLGGCELNFSSDIDLIFGYTAAGETEGPQRIANEQYFEKLVQLLTRYLSQRTADGFVFRVDWMLRPFGSSGPPAMTSSAMVEYYQSHGREWERYAYIKARCVAGDREAGEALLADLRPFVYRRYLDFNAVGALRELKRSIEAEVARKDLHDNIKLGDGGIRELEFIAQAFQLMRGGQEPKLRSVRFRPVLRHLGQAGYLPQETAAALDEAYVFLRRIENALQMQRDEQTHELPETDAARAALCAALGHAAWPALEARIAQVRERVRSEFRRVFAAPADPARESRAVAAVAHLWNVDAATDVGKGLPTYEGPRADAADHVGRHSHAATALRDMGFGPDPGQLVEAILALRQSRLVRALSETMLQRLEALVALVLEDALRERQPETVARRVLDVVGAIAGRATYLTLLRESETARSQLVRLCAASPWIADFIAQSPILLDQLLDERTLYAPPEREEMRAQLEQSFANVAAGDTEAAMNALRRFRQEMMLRVAAADLVKALPLPKISDRLTWLAEVILQKTLALTREEMAWQYGVPQRADGTQAGFAIVAYGKFGGIEMGYGSDLDVVFLHDCDALQAETCPEPGRGAAGGERPLANEVWFSRLAQRIIHWISTQTSAGRAYEVDLELRPDGRRGLTVSTLAGFEQYQKQNAWTWEHQALTRARAVAGDARVREAFERLRRDVLTSPRDAGKLRADVLQMRTRMRAHLDQSRGELFDLKQGEGGLTDIEFITQYLVLRHAPEHAQLVDWSDHWRQTEALAAAGVLEPGKAQSLIEIYRLYRAWLHRRSLEQADSLAPAAEFVAERERIVALWQNVFQTSPADAAAQEAGA